MAYVLIQGKSNNKAGKIIVLYSTRALYYNLKVVTYLKIIKIVTLCVLFIIYETVVNNMFVSGNAVL